MAHRIILFQDEDGVCVAECLDLLGCISQGPTRKDAMRNIKDAIKGYLESLKKHHEKTPVRKNVRVLKVDV
jgi:predicted RNase H-like HicB family nuclease